MPGVETSENPLTTSRAVRMALTKSANDTVGLAVTVNRVAEQHARLDDMLATLPDDLMLIRMERQGRPVGLIGVDMQMRAAILEMETVGALINAPAENRPPTRTDYSLAMPLVRSFLAAFPGAVMRTELDGWLDGAAATDRFANARAAGLILSDCEYRTVSMHVDLGVAEREGCVLLALPLHGAIDPDADQAPDETPWHKAFPENVVAAPARLTALLHRFHMPLAAANDLKVGKMVHLPGSTVEGVKLLSDDGHVVATAKLGQMGGKRAVRLESAPAPTLVDLAGGQATAVTQQDDMHGALDAGDTSVPSIAADQEALHGVMAGSDDEAELLGNDFPVMDIDLPQTDPGA
ncbi:MAG: FliM/FliN family flagellar motor C-terminal domain-containing protein [Pseudomonadota bacterium]